MLIPCIDLQGGQAVQLVHGRNRELAVDDVLGLLERFRGYAVASRNRSGCGHAQGRQQRADSRTLRERANAITE